MNGDIFTQHALFSGVFSFSNEPKKRSVIAAPVRKNNIQFHSALSRQRWQAAQLIKDNIGLFHLRGPSYVAQITICATRHERTLLLLLWNSELLMAPNIPHHTVTGRSEDYLPFKNNLKPPSTKKRQFPRLALHLRPV